MKTFFYTIIICSLLSITFAQSYYVSTVGSDITGTGTLNNPWATIEHAVLTVPNPGIETIINVADGIYDLNNNQIDISRSFVNLTIQGTSTNGTIVQAFSDTSGSTSRVFQIYQNNNVTIKNMTIRYGKVAGSGGGILNRGTLTIDFCKVINNICTTGVGAGVCNDLGTLIIKNSTITLNKAYNNQPNPCYGGGVGSVNGIIISISNSTISYNQAASGGGLFIIVNQIYSTSDANFDMVNSTVSENTADVTGGGIRLAIFNPDSGSYKLFSNINSCTIFKNHSKDDSSVGGGGGIYLSSQTDFNIKNTILAGNTAGPTFASNDLKGLNSNYTITSGDYNLIQTNINVTINGFKANNIYNQDANCLTLDDNNTTNGTQTCRTQTGSPAIDKIPGGNGAPMQDQRGAERNGSYDIGAYEWWTDDGALPVELTSFTSQLKNNKVILNWVTATEVNNYGFEIERRVGSIQSSVGNPIGTGFEKIGFVQGNGNTNSPKQYSFIDDNLFGGSKFQYRLKQLDLDGQFEYSDVVEVEILPDKYSLSQNYPNPFNPSTKIVYSIPEMSNVSIKVYGLLGNEILELVAGEKEPGNYELEFNVQDLSNGVYFYRMQAGKFVQTRKMIFMK